MSTQHSLGVIGLGTMGANLARNAARNGAKVALFNRSKEKTDTFMEQHGSEGAFVACGTLREFVAALDTPRAILLMVKAGQPVDDVIAELAPLLSSGDILIDGGNSLYRDSERRAKEATAKGLRFLGMGVSGGEEGALLGPSMMPGGDESAYRELEPLLRSMSADDGEGGKCVTFIGPAGSGHFVKMVHNGIEYGIMQLIAESYDLLKSIGEFSNAALAETFEHWKTSEVLESYLIDITAKIFRKKDDFTGADLIDVIADAAGQKGTGKWTTDAAMTYGVAIPTINAAVDARILSGSPERSSGKALLESIDLHDPIPPPEKLRSIARHALKLSIICAYLQGFQLMKIAGEAEGWSLPLGEIARIWRGGCIIRSGLLQKFQSACGGDERSVKAAKEAILALFNRERQLDWRRAIQYGVARGIGFPAMSASLSYYDSLRREKLPQNLIQAQRDFFGAHTYKRIDREGVFHTVWE